MISEVLDVLTILLRDEFTRPIIVVGRVVIPLRPAFGFQGHPEASPGPHDVTHLFDHFINLIKASSDAPARVGEA